jgi:hypothetical protein
MCPALILSLVISLFNPGFDTSDGRIDKTRDGRYEVNTKELRTTLLHTSGSNVRSRFVYLGPTRDISRLADGEIRHQFALALRAEDICNRVYVSWHFLAPKKNDEILIQVKANPGQHTHAACGDKGYTTITTLAAPPIRVGEQHVFGASIEKGELVVVTDGKQARLKLPATAFSYNGPAALRSDNAHLIFTVEAQ